MAISGLLIDGATVFLNSEYGSSVSRDPVYLPASVIDAAIADGTFEAGALKNVRVTPPVALWPERWKFLKG